MNHITEDKNTDLYHIRLLLINIFTEFPQGSAAFKNTRNTQNRAVIEYFYL